MLFLFFPRNMDCCCGKSSCSLRYLSNRIGTQLAPHKPVSMYPCIARLQAYFLRQPLSSMDTCVDDLPTGRIFTLLLACIWHGCVSLLHLHNATESQALGPTAANSHLDTARVPQEHHDCIPRDGTFCNAKHEDWDEIPIHHNVVQCKVTLVQMSVLNVTPSPL